MSRVTVRHVGFRFKVMTMTNINDAESTFTCSFFLHLDWAEPLLDTDTLLNGKDPETLVPLQDYPARGFFVPQWKFKNDVEWMYKQEPQFFLQRIQGSTYHILMSCAVSGMFFQKKFSLIDFPFDFHTFEVQIDMLKKANEVVLEPTQTGRQVCESIHHSYPLVEWVYSPASYWSGFVPADRAPDQTWSNLKISLPAARHSGYYIQNCLVPTGILLLICCGVFFMDAPELGDRLGLVCTLLLAAIASKFVVFSHLPRSPYMTLLDKYILVSYIIIVAVGIESIAVRLVVCPKMSSCSQNFDGNADLVDLCALVVYLVVVVCLHIWVWLQNRSIIAGRVKAAE